MYITVKLSLNLSSNLEKEVITYGEDMKNEILRIIEVFKLRGSIYEYPYKEISNSISWYCKGIVLEQAKLGFKKLSKGKMLDFYFSSLWSDYSYKINDGLIIIQLGRKEQERKVEIPFYIHDQQIKRLKQGKYKDMTIVRRHHHWYAYVSVEIKNIVKVESRKKMGIDIGVKNPAVVYTQDEKVKFFGNGRERSFVQRRYRKHIQKMQEFHQIAKLRDFEHKLHRKLTYYDHKTSKEIIDFAIANEVGIIVMESLTNINKSFDIKISKDIYLWSYRRIQQHIAYKAKLVGIEIKYINPRNTSKRCPSCGKLNTPKDRLYTCSCGLRSHRDIVGAHNIMLAL